jgi:hypothetical protein
LVRQAVAARVVAEIERGREGMTSGFEALPEELHETANTITETVGEVIGMVWHAPSGDYGDARVSEAWGRFLDDLHDHVETLHRTAVEHGDQLRAAATSYGDTDIASADQLEKSGIPGGGWAGGVSGVGDAPTGGWVNPGWAGSGWGLPPDDPHRYPAADGWRF